MKMEGIVELKELDRIIQEHAAIKKDYVKLFEEREHLKRELQKRENIEPYLEEVTRERDVLRAIIYERTPEERVTIGMTELETILKQHFTCESVKIEKIKVGTPITTPTFYPPTPMHTLLLDTNIVIRRRKEK